MNLKGLPATAYGNTVPLILNANSEKPEYRVSASHSDLVPGTLYHYRLTAADAERTIISADDTFTTLLPIQEWRRNHFGSPENIGNFADAADEDRDGLSNLVEYAFGLDSAKGESNHIPEGKMTESHFVLSFKQPAGISGIKYQAEWSTSLDSQDWTLIEDRGEGPLHVFSVPRDGKSRIFMRRVVTTL